MSYIPFPDISNVPGVPDIPREKLPSTGSTTGVDIDITNIFSFIQSGSFLSLFNTTVFPSWGIYQNGRVLIEADTVYSLDFNNESSISDYPVEGGSFYSYNKVSTPFTLRAMFVKSYVSYSQTKTDFINAFEKLLRPAGVSMRSVGDIPDTVDFAKDADINKSLFVNIVTPEKTYINVQLVRYNYARRNDNGATLIKIDATFQEVRQPVDDIESPTKKASGSETINKGIGVTSKPNKIQESQIIKTVNAENVKKILPPGG